MSVADGVSRTRAHPVSVTGAGPLSDISPIYVHPSGLIPAIRLVGGTMRQLLEAATWTFVAITQNSATAASLPGMIQEIDPDTGQWRRGSDLAHPLQSFLRAPLGLGNQPEWAWQQLLEIWGMQLYIAGDVYARIRRVRRGRRLVLEPLHPYDVEPIDDGERVVAYRITKSLRVGAELSPSGQTVEIVRPRDILHITLPNPGSLIEGLPPMSVAIRPAEIDRQAQERVKHHLINKVGPGLIFALDHLEEGISDLQETQLREYIAANYQAAVDDGKPMILGNAKVVKAPTDIDKLAYMDVRTASKEEMLAIFRIPQSVVQPQAGVDQRDVRRGWWQSALFPLLGHIFQALNRQAVQPIYGPGTRLWYSLAGSDIGLDMISDRADVAKKIKDLGFSANDAAAKAELEMPWREELEVANMAVVVAGHASDMPGSAPAPAESTPDEVVADA
jgi:phage portal protein BeeE